MLMKECKICSEKFGKPKTSSISAWGNRKTCSKKCSYVYKSQQMKGKIPKNINIIAGSLKGKGAWFECKGCKIKFQRRPKTTYCTKKCWISNKPIEFKSRPNVRGDKSHRWKGGINKENSKIRTSIEYKEWRYLIFIRDNHCCINCGSKEKLRADHIKPFHLFPELRFDVNNGRVLCFKCDKLIGYQFFKENNPRKRLNVETI